MTLVTGGDDPSGFRASVSAGTFGPLAGMTALAAALLPVEPWRDRRGRPPLHPGVVAAALGLPLLGVLLLLLALRPGTPASALGIFPDARPGPLPFLLAAAGLTAAAVVTVRSLERDGWHAGIGAAALALAIGSLGQLLALTVDGADAVRITVAWAQAMPLVAGSLLLFALLGTLHTESSRTRRDTDRAAQVMDGRAEIASTMAHDMRGPVTSIRGLAHTTRTSYERLDDAQRLEFLGMIESEATRVLGLVDEVAVAMKLDAGSLELIRRRQQVGPIVEQAVAGADTGAHPVDVDAPMGVEAFVDERWLGEAVRQVVDNAARFSPPDAPIAVRLRRGADGGAVLTVTDRGPGIPAERRGSVFEMFDRWRPAGYEQEQGAGLGLFVCRGIVRGLGGDVSIEEGDEGGTMLRIRLPLVRPPAEGSRDGETSGHAVDL